MTSPTDHDLITLGDTWLLDDRNGEWLDLRARLEPRRSATVAVTRGSKLVLCGGCRTPSVLEMTPGAAFNEVWVLDLEMALLAARAFGGVGVGGVEWERCSAPSGRVPRCPRMGAKAHTLHGGAVLLVLGGHDTSRERGGRPPSDQFGDVTIERAIALHETDAYALTRAAGGAPGRARTAALATAGLPQAAWGFFSHRAVTMRAEGWSATQGHRVLVHGLAGQPELNGAVGTIISGSADFGRADDRVGVQAPPLPLALSRAMSYYTPSAAAYRSSLPAPAARPAARQGRQGAPAQPDAQHHVHRAAADRAAAAGPQPRARHDRRRGRRRQRDLGALALPRLVPAHERRPQDLLRHRRQPPLGALRQKCILAREFTPPNLRCQLCPGASSP